MEAKFIEIISDSELEKLREAVSLAKELAKLEDLFQLKKELDYCGEKRYDKTKNYNFPMCMSIGDTYGKFKNSGILQQYCILLNHLESGKLVFKDAEV